MTKQSRHSLLIMALLATALLVISGCAPRAGADASVSDGEMHVSFPSILVEYDESGEASVLNMPVSELGELLGGADLSALSFEAETIDKLTGGGIDAIHIDNQPGGLRFFIDGESYPSLVWDEDARSGLATTLDQMGTDAGPVAGILGLMPDLGMGLTMAMPGASSSDLEVSGSSLLDEKAADGILNTARGVSPVAVSNIVFDEDGVPSGNLPIGVTPAMLTLGADTIATFTDNGIETLNIMPTGSGIIMSINGNDLPFIAWDNSELQRMLELLPIFAGDNLDPGLLSFLPRLLNLPLSINLEFPS